MILNGTLISLQAVLAGAASANQPECHVAYVDYNKEGNVTPPTIQRTALNSTTDAIILAAPPFNPTREVISASIYNKDTASVTVTVKTDDGTTERIIAKATLLTLEVLCYEKGQGWYALDANGNRKEATSSVFSSLTVTGNETVGGTLGVTGLITGAAGQTLSTGTLTIKQAVGDVSGIKIYQDTSDVSRIYNHYNGTLVLGVNNSTVASITSAGMAITGVITGSTTIKTGGYTVATLPANAPGIFAYVTDQLTAAAAKGVAPTGGGAVTCYVMNTGAGWVGI